MSVDVIPSEVLLEIFWLTCCDDTSIRERWPSVTEYQDMLKVLRTMTAVSSRWRKIALSTGSLWSHIYCDFEEETLERDMELLRMHMTRSMDAPIHLHLITSNLNHQSARRVGAILEPSLPRWRTALLWRDPKHPALFTGSFSNLTKLSINSLRLHDTALFQHADHRLDSQPPLRELNLVEFEPVALLSTPCSSLVVITLHSMPNVPWDILSQFLSHCLSCVTLAVNCPITQSSSAPLSLVTLPLVESFVVTSGEYTRLFSFPRLRSLICIGAAVSAPGERSMFPHLESVRLCALPEFMDDLRLPWKLSEVYDHARTLDLAGSGKRIATLLPLLSRLDAASARPAHFPALDKLVIWGCRSDEAAWAGFMAAWGSFMASLVGILEARPSLTVECDPLQIAALDRVIGAGSQDKYGARLVVHRSSE